MAKIIVTQNQNDKYGFVLKSRNGKKLLSSNYFDSIIECKNAIEKMNEVVQETNNFRIEKNDLLEPYLVVEFGEGIRLQSECYASYANLNEGINNIRRNLSSARIIYSED